MNREDEEKDREHIDKSLRELEELKEQVIKEKGDTETGLGLILPEDRFESHNVGDLHEQFVLGGLATTLYEKGDTVNIDDGKKGIVIGYPSPLEVEIQLEDGSKRSISLTSIDNSAPEGNPFNRDKEEKMSKPFNWGYPENEPFGVGATIEYYMKLKLMPEEDLEKLYKELKNKDDFEIVKDITAELQSRGYTIVKGSNGVEEFIKEAKNILDIPAEERVSVQSQELNRTKTSEGLLYDKSRLLDDCGTFLLKLIRRFAKDVYSNEIVNTHIRADVVEQGHVVCGSVGWSIEFINAIFVKKACIAFEIPIKEGVFQEPEYFSGSSGSKKYPFQRDGMLEYMDLGDQASMLAKRPSIGFSFKGDGD